MTNIFGMMILDDSATPKTNTFYVYSRAATPVGSPQPNNGFSIEGFPAGNFSSATASAIGLQKTAAAPHFNSNCFIGALGESVNWQLILRDSTGAPIGNPIGGPTTLAAYHTTRILDVFTAASAPVQDYSNVRATFTNTNGSAMIAFCTVETTDNGSADFRVAKSIDARDARQSRQVCFGQDSCGTVTVTNPPQITDTINKNIHYLILDQPDFVQCSLVSPNASDLEIMLRQPGDPHTASKFDITALPAPYNAAPYNNDTHNSTSFYVYTGDKSTINSGATTRWYIDVEFRNSTGNSGDLPVSYGITCTSGNGTTVPWKLTTDPANP